MLDRIGVKRGLAAAVVAWSLAAMAHAFARTAVGFSIARGLLGLGESAIFPASIKTVAEWFPKKERALAAGLFNAGTNMGAILTPMIVPWIALTWGWQWAFIATGALGLLWLALWIPLYRSPEVHPSVTPSELAYIRGDPPDPSATSLGCGCSDTARRGRSPSPSCSPIRSGGSISIGCQSFSTRGTA